MNIVTTNLIGGLGNMLFQIASGYAVSKRDGKKLICETKNMLVIHKPYTEYIQNIFRNIEFSDSVNYDVILQEKGFHFDMIPIVNKNIKLSGYYQSEKYFIDYKSEVLDLFQIDDLTLDYLMKKYGKLLEEDTCSIHIRRGDYLNLQNYHPILSIDYYIEAIKLVGENKHFLIFSDDIIWCENNLGFIQNKTFIKGNKDYQDMYLMSMCKNNIIANSSFSWWGAWLNNNENKIVISSSKWFGSSYFKHDTKDLYPQKWIKV